MKVNRIFERLIPLMALCALLAVSAFLYGCAAKTEGASSNGSSKVIRIGYQKNDPFMILKERGNLEKRLKPLGITVQWNEFQDGPAMLEALNAGSIDVGRTGNSPPIFAIASGSNLVYIASGKSKYEGSGILIKDDSTIQTLADLKGKKVGFSKGSSSHYLIIKALQKAGLKYSDITPAFLKPGDARVAFEKGDIDAWVVWDPFTADAENAIGCHLLVNGKGITTDRDFFVANPNYAKKNKKLLKMVMEEVQNSSDWTNENQEEAAKMIASIIKIDESSMLKAIKRREYGVDPLTADIMNEEQDIANLFYELKITPKKINVKDHVLQVYSK
ncbi:MAG: sulfonate ABC transporter substrate-binding protein [Tuberibacillus sp.]